MVVVVIAAAALSLWVELSAACAIVFPVAGKMALSFLHAAEVELSSTVAEYAAYWVKQSLRRSSEQSDSLQSAQVGVQVLTGSRQGRRLEHAHTVLRNRQHRFTVEKRFDDFDRLHADLRELEPNMPRVCERQKLVGA